MTKGDAAASKGRPQQQRYDANLDVDADYLQREQGYGKKDAAALKSKLQKQIELKCVIDEAKAQLDELKPEIAAEFSALGVKSLAFGGFVHTITNGTNVSIGQEKLKQALLDTGMLPDDVVDVIAKAKTETTYTTMTLRKLDAETVPQGGALTGSKGKK